MDKPAAILSFRVNERNEPHSRCDERCGCAEPERGLSSRDKRTDQNESFSLSHPCLFGFRRRAWSTMKCRIIFAAKPMKWALFSQVTSFGEARREKSRRWLM